MPLKVLILDEFGIWPYDRDAATAFFSLISARYDRASTILTSNEGFAERGELLGDTVSVTAILDRLLHHSHVLNIRGESYRLRDKRQAALLTSHQLLVTGDPEDVPRLMEEEKPHLVLLDLMLPGSDGIELMNRILKIADVPVIFVSVYGQDDVIVRAFDMGAVDYVVKPFSPTELAARIRAALRRRAGPHLAEPSEPYSLGDLTIDYPGHRVVVAGHPVQLTPTEYELLFELSVHAGRVLTHDQLLQRVWGPERTGEPWLVREEVKRLRRKLGDAAGNPAYILTEPRVGYRMVKAETLGQEEA